MKVLIIPGSARPTTAGTELVRFIEAELAAHEGVSVDVATLDDMTLPFVDSPIVPAFDGYTITHDAVQKWTDKVDEADAFVFVVPEYNGGMTGLQKNAIDWVYKQWNGKSAVVVTYNWYDKKSAVEVFQNTLRVIQVNIIEPVVGLKFGEELAPDGAVADESALRAKIQHAVSALFAAERAEV
ncbi:NADPH-dependent FMN reductase [Agromyces atrinae]|nr:NAD(P)H-dependent oxidoreductase [Agromyces atrinae]